MREGRTQLEGGRTLAEAVAGQRAVKRREKKRTNGGWRFLAAVVVAAAAAAFRRRHRLRWGIHRRDRSVVDNAW
jgi:hypothetical protein